MYQKLSKAGFTLTELLAVIAIITLLTAILFPVFARAQRESEKTKEDTCLSNMKRLGLALEQYTQDFDESYPPGANVGGGGTGWAAEVYPYAGSDPGVFMCPSDPTHGSEPEVHFTSYGYNSQLAAPRGVTLAQLLAPSLTVSFFEVQGNNGYTLMRPYQVPTTANPVPGDDYAPYHGGSPAGFGVGGPLDPNGFGSNAGISGGTLYSLKYATGILLNSRTGSAARDFTGQDGRHQKGANYSLADGHARFLLPANVSGGYPNMSSSGDDCGGGGGYYPVAAQTQCPVNALRATFNTL